MKALRKLLEKIDKRVYLTEREHKEYLNELDKALSDFEELKNPIDEYKSKDGKYYCTREAYWSNLGNILLYGYTIEKWRGEYEERDLSYIDPKTKKKKKKIFKTKKYDFYLHYISDVKEKLNEEYLTKHIKNINVIHEVIDEEEKK